MSEDIHDGEPESEIKTTGDMETYGFIGISEKFATLNKLITRDLNSRTSTETFSLFSKDKIQEFISNPSKYEKQLRKAVVYLYGASPHFKRLIQYFAGLSDLAYIVSPYNIDPRSANSKTLNRTYRKVLDTLSAMSIKTQFPKILTVCLREDVFYGTMWVAKNNVTIQQLPSDYCAISIIEGNVFNVTFDFSYFDKKSDFLDFYPPEFKSKYGQYKKNRTKKWIELDSPTSFAIKCNNDIPDYAMPPFAGILREVYEVEEYKKLKMAKTELENYAMLDMRLPMNDEGGWLLDYEKAKNFWRNLDAVLPDEVGSIMSPMALNKISFERTNANNTDTVAEAEQNLFSAAGVQSMLFNNEKASSNSLLLSIKVDQALTYSIVKSLEDMVNRFVQSLPYGKNFKVTFLDCSPFNRKEIGDQYLKAAQYGLPTVMMYAASQGLNQAELDTMNFLENDVLGLKELLVPLQSSNTQSKVTQSADDDKGGRPTKSIDELTDSGEQSSEQHDDWG